MAPSCQELEPPGIPARFKMKRNPKPFSVEIKKSRGPSQRQHLPPRRLFETMLAEATKIFHKDEPKDGAEPTAAPRILPSILGGGPGNSEPVEPVRRKQASKTKVDQGQIELDLGAIISEGGEGGPVAPSAILEAGSQTDAAPVAEEDATPVREAQLHAAESAKAKTRKPRDKAPEVVEPLIASEPVSEPDLPTEMVEPVPAMTSLEAGRHRLARRQRAAAQLPRHARWKRRLHPAVW
ncbi:hypothetical protein DC522_32130 [Microvirga sp. KLBC 81]|nr:hypothetical protein DC522_32130 [Microvirga sp. KLBC 81]